MSQRDAKGETMQAKNTENQSKREPYGQLADAVLPAGGRIDGEFARIAGAEIKALIPVQGETVLRRTIRVLRETGRVGKIAVVGPEEALAEARDAGADAALPEGGSGPENFFRGLDWLERNGTANRIMIAATDLPFLTADALICFLDACDAKRPEIAVPVVSQAAMEARFPGLPGEYVPLREGNMTTGCVFLVDPDVLRRNRSSIEAIFTARKNQTAMARLLGPGFIFRFLLRRLSAQDIEAQCRRILNCSGAAIRDSAPELAFDIDTPEEYEYARAAPAPRKETDYARS